MSMNKPNPLLVAKISESLQKLLACKNWRETLQLQKNTAGRLAIYPIVLACVVRQAGGKIEIADHELAAILAEMRQEQFAGSFQVELGDGILLVKDHTAL